MARKSIKINLAKLPVPVQLAPKKAEPVKIKREFRFGDYSTYSESQLRKQIEKLKQENALLRQQLADERKTIAMTRKALSQRIKSEGREQLRVRVQKATMGLFNGKRDSNAPSEKFTRDLAKTTGRNTKMQKMKETKAGFYDVGPFQDFTITSARRAAHMMIQKYPSLLPIFQRIDKGVLEGAIYNFYSQYHRDDLYDALDETAGAVDDKDYQSFLGSIFSVGLISQKELEELLNEIGGN